ncbi:MAG: STAS domain-containing protein [Rhodococcus sp. (in: high G+C Gram-positive bacteria)]|uniref:STAS domain-containing protein n=1 Tax=Rhodococcus sp. TaxID=1831 RepID=UPI002ADBA2A9|nr:STAS domain-containing protein [Rhodococcus sp. (in: high G+C Gram-positive bacteria)]
MKYNELLGIDITSEVRDAAIVLRVKGEVDLATASDLAHRIERAVRASPVAVIVDLSGVTFLASVGMTVLISARRRADCSTSLVVVASGPTTEGPMHMVGLDAAIPIFTDVGSALDAMPTTGSTVSELPASSRATAKLCAQCGRDESTDNVRTA